MAEKQRWVTEFCVQFGKSVSETLQLIHQAYGQNAMRRAAVFSSGGSALETEKRT
jgi:hypothetical protein